MYGEIFAILTTVSFALSFVLSRKIEKEATPIFQSAIRSLIGFVVFFIICLFSGFLSNLIMLPIFVILVLGLSILFTVIIGDTSYLQSQKVLGPAKALAITNTTPFFTILFATLFLNRIFTFQMIISGILIGIGVVIIAKQKVTISNQETQFNIKSLSNDEKNKHCKFKLIAIPIRIKGLIWASIAAISWAIGLALSDYSISQVNQILGTNILSTILALMVRFLFAAVILNTIAFIEERHTPTPRNRNTWKILIISAILSYVLGSIFFGEAVHIVGASFMSLISTALPLFTIPFSYIINKEKLTKRGFLGVILTIIGVVIILF
jgi:DME family drug/metabolite transporter